VSSLAVSVIVPCHNAAEFLADALQSVRDQTVGDFECIVVDDRSTDGSVAIANRFVEADPRFRLIASNERNGASTARNVGIAEAAGRWLALLDADDLFLPERLELLTQIGDAEGADLIFDDQVVTEFPGRTSERRAFGFTKPRFAFSEEDFFSRSRLFRRSFPAGYMKPLMRRDFLRRAGAAYDPSMPSGEDFLFYAQLFSNHPHCIGTSFAGYVYRRRRGSLSRSDQHLHFQAQLSDRILDELGPRLSSRSRADLAARRGDFERIAAAMPAIIALRERNWLRLAWVLIKQPKVVGTCIRLLRTRAARSWSAIGGR
jgi:succinoglycan biosynthesis protein ExoO